MHDTARRESRRRPRFLNLSQIRLPVGALASVSHRASGVLLVLATPLALYVLDVSLHAPDRARALWGQVAASPLRLALVLPAWALAYHLVAGLRVLALDLGVGESLEAARASAQAAVVAGLVVALAAGAVLL
jgi:succinate dehydrogenase / fumarate reductase cytochrome b subunit